MNRTTLIFTPSRLDDIADTRSSQMTMFHSVGFYDLPFDIVYEVFSLAAIHDPEWAPVVISHCCRRWREDSLNSPLLWSRITFRRSFPKRINEDFSLKQKIWIERSKESPLEIMIGRQATKNKRAWMTPTFGDPSITRILKLILPQSHRWQLLKIDDITDQAWRYVCDKLRAVDAPMLTRLEFFLPWNLSNKKPTLFKNRTGAPNVRELAVGAGVEFHKWQGHLFQTLTTFTYGQITMDPELVDYRHLTPFLSNNPDLERLTLTWQISDSYLLLPPPIASIALPKLVDITLTKLVLYGQSIGEMTARFLLHLDAPNLTNIYPPRFDPSALKMLASVPRVSFAKIQHFGIGVQPFSSDRDIDVIALVRVLSQLHDLRSFSLDYGKVPRGQVGDWSSLIITPFCKHYPLLDTLVFHEQYSKYAADHPNSCIEPAFLQRIVEERRLHPLLKNIHTLDIGRMLISQEQKAWFMENIPKFIHQ